MDNKKAPIPKWRVMRAMDVPYSIVFGTNVRSRTLVAHVGTTFTIVRNVPPIIATGGIQYPIASDMLTQLLDASAQVTEEQR